MGFSQAINGAIGRLLSSLSTEIATGSAGVAFRIGLRVLAVSVCASLVVYLITRTELYATIVVLAAITAFLIADLVRAITRLHNSTERLLNNLIANVVETPVHPFAGHTKALGTFERAVDKLNSMRAEHQQALTYQQTLLDTVAAALIIVRGDGRIKLANRAARRLATQPVERLEDIAAVGQEVSYTLLALAPGARKMVQMRDGHYMLASVAQLHVAGRSSERFISLQRINGELDAVEIKAWQDMARVLAHEMMNSLTPIASLSESLELLLRDMAPSTLSQETIGALDAIKRRSHGLMNFVERYRKLEELPQPRIESIRMSDFLAGIERLMGSTFRDKKIAYKIGVLPTDLHLSGDPELLEQALINLLRNACDAMAGYSDALLEVSCELLDGQSLIRVVDNGHGLAEQESEQIFLPFYTTRPNGSGIGLTLARQIALAHGGQLSAHARVPRGAIFELQLPTIKSVVLK